MFASPPNALPRLREERLQRGLTQAELAEAAGVGTPYISMIESGQRWPRERVRRSLALFLDVPLFELWGPGR